MATKKRMDQQLPPTPCTQKMRESLIKIAEREGRSIADLQREAISLFLSGFDTNSIRVNRDSINQERVREGQS